MSVAGGIPSPPSSLPGPSECGDASMKSRSLMMKDSISTTFTFPKAHKESTVNCSVKKDVTTY